MFCVPNHLFSGLYKIAQRGKSADDPTKKGAKVEKKKEKDADG